MWIGADIPQYKNKIKRKSYTKNQAKIVRFLNYFLPKNISTKLWKFVVYKLNK